VPSEQERFAELIADPEPPLDLGAAMIAACACPGVDAGTQVDRLDDLAKGCPEASIDGLRAYLFEELGFAGDGEHYADPANSYLHAVLDRRRGIPISLSVVLMEVGRRVGVHIGGVSMPGHFLAKSLHEPELFIDAFRGGRLLGEPECRELFGLLHDELEFTPSFLDVVGSRSILWRMLNNLRQGFASRGDLANLRWTVELQLEFPDIPVAERRHLAALLGMSGNAARAARELESLAEALAPDDAESARRQAHVLRSRMN